MSYANSLLAQVAEDTIYYTKDVVEKFPILVKNSIENTKYFASYVEVAELNKKEGKYDIAIKNNKNKEAKVEVQNKDTIDCALQLVADKYNVLSLNMASDFCPGGGYKKGSQAQEESIFRRSTYHLSLEQKDIINRYRLPLLAGIYSPNIIIFRGSSKEDHYLYDWPECTALNFIAVPALRNPKLVKVDTELRLKDKDVIICSNKFRLIFETAIYYGHDALVLGAAGSGAFHCPPIHVAQIFKKIIAEYSKYFSYIVFAILTDQNDKYGNLASYQKVFS
jgi:uncharacterized protein (TIGR02452 family)